MKYLILLFTILSLGFFVWANRETYSQKYDVAYWQDAFLDSQIVRGGRARNPLSDYDLYAILGYKYWHGDSPMNLHPEVPPLGKQIIGLGILVFNNQNLLVLLIGIACIFLVYLITLETMGDTKLAIMASFLFSLNSEFRHLLISSNLDIPQLLFLLVSIFAFIRGLKHNYWFWLSSLSLGWMMATKFYFSGLIVMGLFLFVVLIIRKFTVFIRYITSLIFVPLAYISSYIPALIQNPDIIYFIKFQRWLSDWWAGNAGGTVGNIYSMIFTGWWRTWWESAPQYIRIPEWDISWPILATIGILSVLKIVKNKDWSILILWLWPFSYLVFLTFTTPFPRYTLLLFPFWSLLTVYLLKRD